MTHLFYILIYLFFSFLLLDFCKHIFVPNFANVLSNVVEITEDNKALVESGYEARTEKELAVLTRYGTFFCYFFLRRGKLLLCLQMSFHP